MTGQTESEVSWYSDVKKSVQNLLYFTESEAPLILLETAPIKDLAALQKFIADECRVAASEQQLIPVNDFLNDLFRSTDPQDPIIQLNTERFADLFSILKKDGRGVHVIRVNGTPDLIFIAAIGSSGSAVIRTEATET